MKQLHGGNVRKLIQKIENHPHRQALQQSRQFNPFSEESKKLIHEVGNIELCELLDVETKAQCKVCLSYWDVGIVYCSHASRSHSTPVIMGVGQSSDAHGGIGPSQCDPRCLRGTLG